MAKFASRRRGEKLPTSIISSAHSSECRRSAQNLRQSQGVHVTWEWSHGDHVTGRLSHDRMAARQDREDRLKKNCPQESKCRYMHESYFGAKHSPTTNIEIFQ